jgi:hypothetical protein
MPQKQYLITLEDAERKQLEQLLHSGVHATRQGTRARIRLKAAEGWEDGYPLKAGHRYTTMVSGL